MRTSRLLPHCLLLLLLLMLASSVFFSQTSIAPKAVSALPTQQWVSVVDKVRGAIVTIETQLALGTGFLVAKNGTIVTNYHVIKDAQQITITLQNGEIYRSAYLLRTDEDRDIAMLRIQGADLPFISLGNSDAVKVGEDVLAIGTPEGLEQTASNGIISARRVGSGYELLQTTAPISHGSSGGPLLNRAGQSIGVMTLFLNEGQNLNFAVPINYVREMLDSLDLSSNQSARLISGNAQKISNKPVLTVTASSPIVTYGDPVPGVTPTYAGFVNGDSASVLVKPPLCTTAYTRMSNAGSSQETTCSGGESPNYTFNYVSGRVTVNKASLTIIASSATITYGDAIPVITPNYRGFVNGETSSVLTKLPMCAIDSTPLKEQPSTSCSGATARNYALSYMAGTFAVTNAPPNTSSKAESSAATGKLVSGQDAHVSCGPSVREIPLMSGPAGVPIRYLNCGDAVRFIRLDANLWAQVRTIDNTSGYVSAWFISGDVGSVARAMPESITSVRKPDSLPPATIWLYRTKSSTDSMLNPTIYSKGRALARLDKGRFFTLSVPPGTYYFSLSESPKAGSEAWVTVASGQVFFFKVKYTEIKPVFAYEAGKDLKNLKPVEDSDRSSDVLTKAR